MRTKFLSIILAFLCIHAYSQTFPCDGRILLSYNQGSAPSYTYRVAFGSFGLIYYNQYQIFPTGNFNAMGFNPKDNFIYAVEVNTNNIIRIKADGTYEKIGEVPFVDVLNSSAGDCNIDGYYMIHDRELDQILVYDVVDGFELIDRIDLTWNPQSINSGPVSTRIDDFAFDPTNPTAAYSYQGDYFNSDLNPEATRGYLLTINLDLSSPNKGFVTPIAKIPQESIRQIGSLFFTSEGALYGYGSKTEGPVLRQNSFFSINKVTGALTENTAVGPTAAASDGCSCPYSLSFELTPSEVGVLCTSTGLTYTLTINNRFNQGLSNVTLLDTLPQGMLIESVTGDFTAADMQGTGIGTQYFGLTGLEIPPRSITEIKLKVQIVDLEIDFNAHQAILTNLPSRFPHDLVSDDPGTTETLGDPTRIFVIPQTLDEFTFDVSNPSDCINAADGTVMVSSPTFLPEALYTVKLRDQNYDESVYEVLIDKNNAFLLDSIAPGEYDIFQITPSTSKCSFAIEDTTVNVLAPNDKLQASIESNSPICEFTPLELYGRMSQAGSVSWKGPELFASSELNPIIRSTLPGQSGVYEMTASYGYCEQIKTVEVLIAPTISAKIVGANQFCEGRESILSVEGKGELLDFRWSTPANNSNFNSASNVSSINADREGLFQVIVNNGGCQDTASATIEILTSPKISMVERIETDFCEPVSFQPNITGTMNANYAWSHPKDLSCEDCLEPELLSVTQGIYTLTVTNENSCRDSATISVFALVDNPIYVPNAFSPNNDGNNDYFRLTPGCGLSRVNKIRILDRWGGTIYSEGPFKNTESDISWDGSVNGKTGSPGVYIWQAEIELVNGKIRSIYGDVTLLP